MPDLSTADSPANSLVRLGVPADGAYVYVLRTTAAALAARGDFTVDDVEDLRIAIGEAAALLVDGADTDGVLECVFTLGAGEIEADLSVASARPLSTDTDSFAWQVLSTLTASCSSAHVNGRASITLVVRSILEPAIADGLG